MCQKTQNVWEADYVSAIRWT